MSIIINCINGRFQLGKEIGNGSFGKIYYGENLDLSNDNEDKKVAIKLELLKNKPNLLDIEGRCHDYLNNMLYTPKLYWCGVKDDYNVIIMQLLGPSLGYLFKKCKNIFSYNTISYIAIRILKIIAYIHSKGIVHRDIKPENFLLGLNNNNIYIIDFGFCKVFKPKNIHIPFSKNKKMIGTLRYLSCNSHDGHELSRRDDLESIGYMLIYFAKGKLPWQSLKKKVENGENDAELIADYDAVHKIKSQIKNEDLCKFLPIEFKEYMDYVKSLEFETKPDYKYLISLFENISSKDKNIYLDWEN